MLMRFNAKAHDRVRCFIVDATLHVPIKTLVIDGNCRVEDRHNKNEIEIVVEASSKTKNSKKIFMLRPQRDALVNGSGSKQTYRYTKNVITLLQLRYQTHFLNKQLLLTAPAHCSCSLLFLTALALALAPVLTATATCLQTYPYKVW
uniref:Histidine kinase-like ATPase, ATP-binding domain-containing protein n=1 Tax=Tanacetum cinerariifolium TaxID=118510 RepID=A0A699H1D4_TANCI|nr:histidine kinase-like ATPase, ATP-binding domain-containing protein [Tanacetum cinerariifolium]